MLPLPVKEKGFGGGSRIKNAVSMCLCICAFCLHDCLCTTCTPDALGGQRAPGLLELELQIIVSHYAGAGN